MYLLERTHHFIILQSLNPSIIMYNWLNPCNQAVVIQYVPTIHVPVHTLEPCTNGIPVLISVMDTCKHQINPSLWNITWDNLNSIYKRTHLWLFVHLIQEPSQREAVCHVVPLCVSYKFEGFSWGAFICVCVWINLHIHNLLFLCVLCMQVIPRTRQHAFPHVKFMVCWCW